MTVKLLSSLSNHVIQSFSFFVPGKPETQGSKSAFGRVYTDKEGRQRVAVSMAEQSKGLYAWRALIGRTALRSRPTDWALDGTYLLSAVFYMPRPKMHFNARGELKSGAPVLHHVKGDADKLLRACGDALTKVCYDDDALIVAATSMKLYCGSDGPGAHITISRLDDFAASAMMLALKP